MDHASPDLLIPSIPASQALRLQSSQQPSSAGVPSQGLLGLGFVSTGLASLDAAILPSAGGGTSAGNGGGFARGSAAEVYGPPGVGKTSLLLNTAVKALAAGERVVWIDTSSPIPKPRLQQLLSNLNNNNNANKEIENITHIRTPSLPHLLALLTHPPTTFPPPGTSLVVVDSVSAPFQSYFPNPTEIRSRLETSSSTGGGGGPTGGTSRGTPGGKDQQTQFLLNRKRAVTSDLASHAAKLASTHNLAVVLVNQTHTKIRGLPRPTLYPALATGGAWESCISTRIVLYRDFFERVGKKGEKVRFAEMMKKGGKVLGARKEGDIVRFVIEDNGLRELQTGTQPESIPISTPISLPVSVRKRKVGEIADSEEEEDEDEFEDDLGDEYIN
ncbi:hypothetical protein PISL3812_03938 [Talaromyces islandicus]|uniref:DNA repair protein RAD51 homolog 3 n=1 Tax=Talaromyces islandicus TaxID=28573 RepID=A0A0U1LUM0_TALIS|nr:hypothetical protein PISL3812_03938 [Talaromyces islandicus]